MVRREVVDKVVTGVQKCPLSTTARCSTPKGHAGWYSSAPSTPGGRQAQNRRWEILAPRWAGELWLVLV